MADEKQDERGIGQLLSDLTNRASGDVQQKGSPVLLYILFASVTVIIFAVMGFLVVRAKRRAAQAEYDLRKKEEEIARAKEDERLAKDSATRAYAETEVRQLEDEAVKLKEKRKQADEESIQRAVELTNAASWGDLEIVDKRQK